MIKIHEKLWGIFNEHKKQHSFLNTDPKLAYMTYKQDNAAFEKRKQTGIDWATYRNKDVDLSELTFEHDNVPMDGFTLIDTVERYATSNKLFRVLDPRGFIVEVSTEYIFELIQNSIIDKGLIKDKCVWGVDRMSHVLIPVTSNLYVETVKDQDTVENKLLTFTQLKVGDVFKIFKDDNEYVYLGKAKSTFSLSLQYKKYDYKTSKTTVGPIRHIVDVEDNTYIHVYYCITSDKNHYHNGYYINNPKIVSILKSNYNVTKLREKFDYNIPYRFRLKFYETMEYKQRNTNYGDEEQVNIKSTIWKDK